MPHFARFVIACCIVAPAFARAQETVHRCIGEHGEISFSSAPCTRAGAPLSAPATESTTVPSTGGAAATCPASPAALRDLVAAAFARRDANLLAGAMLWDGVGGGAARARMRELAELTQQPLLGIDLDDSNDALADGDRDDADGHPAYDRRGYDRDAYDDRDDDASDADVRALHGVRRDAPSDDVLVVRTGALAGGAGEHAFRLTPSGGCYWLDW